MPLGILTFTSSFIKDAQPEDVRHVNLFLIMDDVQLTYGTLTRCFLQRPLYLL
jgi:hypothetical protein